VRKTFLVVVTLCLGAAALGARSQQSGAAAARPGGAPRLLVMLVVDQFAYEYIDLYGQQWTHGLHRLIENGALFTNARYPYSGTVTCPGHTSIGTGAVPAVHGMINNTWYDRTARRTTTCTDDATVEPVAMGGGDAVEHHSPKFLTTTTFADEFRRQTTPAPRILSVSLKPRSAIGMAGHPGPNTMVVWEEDNGTFATSTAYAAKPWPEIDEYVASHPISAAFDQVWRPALPLSAYRFDDNAPGETMPDGWGRTFPHRLLGDWDVPDAKFVTVWEHSPWSDAYLGDMTIALMTKLQLGQRGATDMLALSFSALDLVGHAYGPRSHEVQDLLVRLDVTIGKVLDALDRNVGRDRYLIGMSADHGIPPLPEQGPALGLDAGRIPALELRQKIQTGLGPIAGEAGTAAIANITDNNVYFDPAVLERLRRDRGVMRAIGDALLSVKGVAHVYWADELAARSSTADPILRAARLSYVAGRSGDLVIIPKPYWMVRPTGTTHGSANDYDRHVPLVLIGAGVVPGRYTAAASPLDIAATFASLVGVKLPHSDGRVLREAFGR
jgi:predicted AlkP superfamily pyrophosphatase or phosphodiesterase